MFFSYVGHVYKCIIRKDNPLLVLFITQSLSGILFNMHGFKSLARDNQDIEMKFLLNAHVKVMGACYFEQ